MWLVITTKKPLTYSMEYMLESLIEVDETNQLLQSNATTQLNSYCNTWFVTQCIRLMHCAAPECGNRRIRSIQ